MASPLIVPQPPPANPDATALGREINSRKQELIKAGCKPNDTQPYGPSEALAKVADARLNHEKGETITDGRPNGLRMSPQSMAVTWGGFRGGVGVRDGYTSDGFQTNTAAGTEKRPASLKCGTNAYMSEPYFAYYSKMFPNPA